MKSPHSLLLSKLTSPSPSAFLQRRIVSWPPLDPLQKLNICSVLRAPDLDTVLQMGHDEGRAEETITYLSLLVTVHLMQPRKLLAFRPVRTHCWFTFNFSSIRTLKSFSIGLLSMSSSPILQKCLGLPRPKHNILHMALLHLIRFIWAHIPSLSRSLWMAFLRSIISTAPLCFPSWTNLLRIYSNNFKKSCNSKFWWLRQLKPWNSCFHMV